MALGALASGFGIHPLSITTALPPPVHVHVVSPFSRLVENVLMCLMTNPFALSNDIAFQFCTTTVLQRLLGVDQPANKVVEIKSEALGTLQVLARDDAMLLFAPPFNSSNEKRAVYEIILQRPTSDSNTTSFSLYRSPVQQEAEERFNAFLQRLPVFVSIVKEVRERTTKQCEAMYLTLYFSVLQCKWAAESLRCLG